MSTLIIRRKHVPLRDRLRDYVIVVDGREVARVADGADVHIPVTAGRHVVQLKIDWCSSNSMDITVDTGSETMLECGPNAKPLLALLYITFWRGKYLWLAPATAMAPLPLQ